MLGKGLLTGNQPVVANIQWASKGGGGGGGGGGGW